MNRVSVRTSALVSPLNGGSITLCELIEMVCQRVRVSIHKCSRHWLFTLPVHDCHALVPSVEVTENAVVHASNCIWLHAEDLHV